MIDLFLMKYGKKLCVFILAIMILFLIGLPVYDRLSIHTFKKRIINGKVFYKYKLKGKTLYINQGTDRYIITVNYDGTIIKTLYYPLVDKTELLRYIKTITL